MALRHSYTILAPVYDLIVSGAMDSARQCSLARIKGDDNQILINGIGSGLDIPFLPVTHRYVGSDITPAMLRRAEARAQACGLPMQFEVADSQALPFADASFDCVVMHLILAVVPQPQLALNEACRVLRPGGQLLIFDKFIRRGQLALGRRLLSVVLRHIATRTDVIFEELLENCPQLQLLDDQPAMAAGWFRHLELQKQP